MNDQFFQQKNERKYIRLTQCYDQLYDELFRMEAHAHEGIELMFVREGRINFFFSVAGMVYRGGRICYIRQYDSPSPRSRKMRAYS